MTSQSFASTMILRSFCLLVVSSTICGCDHPSASQLTAGSGKNFNENRFFVLLFPVRATLEDVSGESHQVRRAAIASIAEYNQQDFTLFIGRSEVVFPRDSFVLNPQQDPVGLIDNLSDQLLIWGAETDWSDVKWSRLDDGNSLRFSLKLRDRSGSSTTYHYSLDELGDVSPLDATRVL